MTTSGYFGPEFDRLLRDMRGGVVTQVVLYDQDRLGATCGQLEGVVNAVEAGHAMLTSVNGDIDLRRDHGPDGPADRSLTPALRTLPRPV